MRGCQSDRAGRAAGPWDRGVVAALLLLAGMTVGLFLTPTPADAFTMSQVTNTSGGESNTPSINADGTRIAFQSSANLTGGNLDGNWELFLWTQGSGLTQLTTTTGGTFFSNWNPAISADGTRIAFVSDRDLTGGNSDGNDEIFLWTQGSGLTQVTSTTGYEGSFHPTISADGTRIAFVSDRDLTGGNPDHNDEIFLWTQGGGFTQVTSTTGYEGSRNPTISADGTRIAFVSDRDLTGGNPDHNDEIFLWTQGGGFTQVTSTTAGLSQCPSINADGTRIAFQSRADLTGDNPDGNGDLFRWDQTSGFIQITNTTGGSYPCPSINADGTRIAFDSTDNLTGGNPDGGAFVIFLWTQGSGFTQVTTSTGNSVSPSINGDGTRIALASTGDLAGGNRGHNFEIFRWDQSSGFIQVTSTWGGRNDVPTINADGTRIAFASSSDPTGGNFDSNYEIFLWTQGSGLTQLTTTTSGDSYAPSISADGSRFAFYSSRDLTGGNPDGNWEIFLWTQGSGITQITTSIGDGGSYSPSISADGTRIAFVSDRDPIGGNSDGNDEIFLWTESSGITQITNTTGSFVNWGPSVSADGTQIAFVSSSNLGSNLNIFRWDQTSGITQLTTSEGCGNWDPSISADGTRIAFWASCGATGSSLDNVFLWTQGSGLTQVTNTTEGYTWDLAISADGTRIAFSSGRDLTGGNSNRYMEIFRWDQLSGFTQVTTSSVRCGKGAVSINADGTRIAFESNCNPTGGNFDGNYEIFLATIHGSDLSGVRRRNTWYLDHNGNGVWDGCTTDRCINFGLSTDTPVVGDWNGDGRSKVGVRRGSTWYLDYNGNGVFENCTTDRCLSFGLAMDTPVVGDWNGDGRAKLGVRRGNAWYLDYNGNGLWDGCGVDRCLGFGLSTDTPVTGDWNGDGRTKLGIRRGSAWYLDYNGNGVWDGCTTDRCLGFGASTDTPVAGDWNGDGRTKLGVRRGNAWYLDYNGDGVFTNCTTDRCLGFGLLGDAPAPGAW